MRATIKAEDLRAAFQKVNLVGNNRTLPVLSNVRMDFAHGKVTTTATNMEQAIRMEVDSTNDDMFSVLLPRRSTSLFLTGENGRVAISGVGKLERTISIEREGLGSLSLMPGDIKDFPPVPDIPDSAVWSTLDAKCFCRMLGFVVPACATEDSRPILTGVACRDGAMASADGFRLVTCKSEKLNFGLGKGKQVIIPAIALNMVRRLFGKAESLDVAFEIQFPDIIRRVYFKSDNVTLMSELTQGNYPDYEQLMPPSFNCKVSFSAPLMSQRIKMVDTRGVGAHILRVVLRKTEPNNEHECILSAGIDDGDGQYSLRLPVTIETEEVGKIAFNPKYIEDAMKPFSMCSLEIVSPSSPGKFTGDIEELTMLVMPMFVQW